jgi:hypothetical protein
MDVTYKKIFVNTKRETSVRHQEWMGKWAVIERMKMSSQNSFPQDYPLVIAPSIMYPYYNHPQVQLTTLMPLSIVQNTCTSFRVNEDRHTFPLLKVGRSHVLVLNLV